MRLIETMKCGFWEKIRKKVYYLIELPVTRFVVTKLPISNNKIVVDNFGGKGYGGNPRYIVEALLKINPKDFDIVWVVDNAMPKKDRSEFPPCIKVVDIESIRGLYERATAKMWIDNVRHYHPIKKRVGQLYLQTWHGSMSAKKVEKDAEKMLLKEYIEEAKYDGKITDAIIADNYLQERIYMRAFWLNDNVEILRFGFPQNDSVEIERESKEKIEFLKGSLSISDEFYYVLYAPTFRDDYSVDGYNIDFRRVIEAFERRIKKKVKIIVRLHPNVAFQKKQIKFSENILDGTDYPNVQDLALVCDAVISDYSSTLFDFSIMGKPAFVCALDYKDYEEKRGFIPEFSEFPFPFSASNDALVHIINSFDMEQYINDVKEFYVKYPTYCDGHSSEKAANWILRNMKLRTQDLS